MDAGIARETSGVTNRLVMCYVRAHAGEEGVREVIKRAALPYTVDQLNDESHWTSYDERIRLFQATMDVLDSEDPMFEIGAEASRQGLQPQLALVLRSLGSPRQVYRRLPKVGPSISTTSTTTVLEATATTATIHYKLHDGYQHSRLDCRYVQGLIVTVPEMFGLGRARIMHEECESDGFDACIYRLSWGARSVLPWRRRTARLHELNDELLMLRGQLTALQSAATDLVSTTDLDAVLRRVVTRAASAVLAQGYLLVLPRGADQPPLIRHHGIPAAQLASLARRLEAGDELGANAVVVDVASARRHHGRLAALHPQGRTVLSGEHDLLAAYAGHVAAALDTVLALDEARRGEERARRLLELSHSLSAAGDANQVARAVAEALPGITGCDRATMLLWDQESGELIPTASAGLQADDRNTFFRRRPRPEHMPELASMLELPALHVYTPDSSSERLRVMLEDLGVSQVVVGPVLSGTRFLGVITVEWLHEVDDLELGFDVADRMWGVAEQAATALQNVHLVERMRHQVTHDPLTGLPNRTLFMDRVSRALAAARRSGDCVAVLFADLDRFKAVNDTLGHGSGDELLVEVASRLREAVRESDTVCRLAGDEFALLLPEVAGADALGTALAKLAAAFDAPFHLSGHAWHLGLSVGSATSIGGDSCAADLLQRADREMYRNKERNRPGAMQIQSAPTA